MGPREHKCQSGTVACLCFIRCQLQRPCGVSASCLGKHVQVEGLAWGYDVNTLMPKSRVIFDGGTVLVKGVDFNKAEVRGRVVRVVGTLLLESMSLPGVSRQLPKYYCIEAKSFEVVEQATDPRVVARPKQEE